MPHVIVKLLPGRSEATTKKLAQEGAKLVIAARRENA
jgi:NADP-dependent 3-hydroxy acid dehydrogenase YdfG